MIVFIRRHKVLKILLEALVLLLLLTAIRAYVQRDVVSGAAPMISGRQVDGMQVNLSQFRGAPVLVHFWASWCGVCRLEEQSIDGIAKDYPVITVAMQSGDEDEISLYLQQQGLGFPVLSDPQGQIASRYGIKGVPASFIIGKKGNIRFVELGYSTEIGLRFRLWLANWM